MFVLCPFLLLIADALNDCPEIKSGKSDETSSYKKAKSKSINYETGTDSNLDLEKLNQELDHVINDNPELKMCMKKLKEVCEKEGKIIYKFEINRLSYIHFIHLIS